MRGVFNHFRSTEAILGITKLKEKEKKKNKDTVKHNIVLDAQ